MKLLFDENLSPHLPNLLSHLFSGCSHVRTCGLEGQTDQVIWDYAVTNGFIIVSKDGDFYERSLLVTEVPKIIWIRVGNCSRNQLVDLLTRRANDVRNFESSPASLLMLF